MISAQKVNEKLFGWNGSRTLKFHDEVDGDVVIPAGVTGPIEFTKPIHGKLNIGGFGRPGCRKGFVDLTQADLIWKSDDQSALLYGRRVLRLDDDHKPTLSVPLINVSMGLHVEAQVNGMVYVKNCVNFSCNIDVDGQGFDHSHGMMVVECLNSTIKGSASRVGVGNTKPTGWKYGLEVQSSWNTCIENYSGSDVRYLITLTDSNTNTSIRGVSGDASGALVDVHRGIERGLFITDVDGVVKLFNESWDTQAPGAIVERCKQVRMIGFPEHPGHPMITESIKPE